MRAFVKITMICVVLLASAVLLVLLCSNKCASTPSEESAAETLPELTTNEQMLEFILKSAKEWFGDPNVTLTEFGYGHSRRALELVIPHMRDITIVIYPCIDKAEYHRINNLLGADAASEFRLYPVLYYYYGDMIIVLYSGEKSSQVELFLESIVIDTRQGMVMAERWQKLYTLCLAT